MEEATTKSSRIRLIGLRSEEYEHPLDRSALDALEGTPGLENLLRRVNQYGIEKLMKTMYTGSYIKVAAGSFPKVYSAFQEVCEIIHLKPVPDLYVGRIPDIDAFTIGSENPIVILADRAVECFTAPELAYVMGHEIGHIKSQHGLYHMLANQIFPYIGELITTTTLGVGGLLTTPIQLALASWSRKAEFTCDRAGLLACQDLDAAITTLMKIAGAPSTHYSRLDPSVFLSQAREFKGYDEDSLNRIIKILINLENSHPWTVMRCAELSAWVDSGDYQMVIDKYTGKQKCCDNCGQLASIAAKFCKKCGAKI